MRSMGCVRSDLRRTTAGELAEHALTPPFMMIAEHGLRTTAGLRRKRCRYVCSLTPIPRSAERGRPASRMCRCHGSDRISTPQALVRRQNRTPRPGQAWTSRAPARRTPQQFRTMSRNTGLGYTFGYTRPDSQRRTYSPSIDRPGSQRDEQTWLAGGDRAGRSVCRTELAAAMRPSSWSSPAGRHSNVDASQVLRDRHRGEFFVGELMFQPLPFDVGVGRAITRLSA